MKTVKAKMKTGDAKKPLIKAQDGRIIKSNKVRTADLNTFGPSEASVSKTKRDGSTVTKSVKTNQGYVPSAEKTKTVTDKQGNTTSSTKDMAWNKANRQQMRIAKNVGRNANDVGTIDGYKRGGTTKMKTGGMVNSNKKVTASKVAKGTAGGVSKAISKAAVNATSPKGRVGGTSTAPKKAKPGKN